jgi:hypothetical protein
MFCPSCSTAAPEGGKFCKSCGLNLTAITQAVGGVTAVLDPIREREYRRARKKISDGIQGSTIGAAVIVVAALAYFLLPSGNVVYALSLVLGLVGIVTFFRSIGHIIDAKVGPKLLGPALQPRGTGPLNASTIASVTGSLAATTASRRLPAELARPQGQEAEARRTTTVERGKAGYPPPPASGGPSRTGTGRVNIEQSSQLRKKGIDDDFISKLRN